MCGRLGAAHLPLCRCRCVLSGYTFQIELCLLTLLLCLLSRNNNYFPDTHLTRYIFRSPKGFLNTTSVCVFVLPAGQSPVFNLKDHAKTQNQVCRLLVEV